MGRCCSACLRAVPRNYSTAAGDIVLLPRAPWRCYSACLFPRPAASGTGGLCRPRFFSPHHDRSGEWTATVAVREAISRPQNVSQSLQGPLLPPGLRPIVPFFPVQPLRTSAGADTLLGASVSSRAHCLLGLCVRVGTRSSPRGQHLRLELARPTAPCRHPYAAFLRSLP